MYSFQLPFFLFYRGDWGILRSSLASVDISPQSIVLGHLVRGEKCASGPFVSDTSLKSIDRYGLGAEKAVQELDKDKSRKLD